MFKDQTALEYAIETIRVLHKNPSRYDSNTIFQLSGNFGSISYMKKILYRLSKIGILSSDNDGYQLAKNPDSIPLADLLNLIPQTKQGYAKAFEDLIKKQISSSYVGQLWNQ